jgi:alpha-tubulin suppressor-like RCC1 family protein
MAAAGDDFSLALTVSTILQLANMQVDGRIYSCGNGMLGQTGRGQEITYSWSPIIIDASDIFFIAISAIDSTSMAISNNGKLLVF